MSHEPHLIDWSHPRIAVVGTGAVGSYYGGRLAQHGHEVHFLLRSDYEIISRKGWHFRSCDGDFTLQPEQIKVYNSVAQMPKADLVLVCLKTTSNNQYAHLIAPLLHESSVVLTMQNGLGNEEQLAALFGGHRVMGGMAFVCLNRLEPGLVNHIDQGWIQIGEFIGGPNQRGEALAGLFNKSGVDCKLLSNLKLGRWDKLVWNVPFNGLGAALDLTTDQLIGTEAGLELVLTLMREVFAGAHTQGVELPQSSIDTKVAFTRTMGAYQSSMQIDRRLGRPMEVEAILGEPVRVSKRAGTALPNMEALYRFVKAVDAVNLGNIGYGK